jgi:ATP-dependent DNA helicase PIF1
LKVYIFNTNQLIFEKISEIFQILRNSEKPFGGVQIILVGDPFQLCPIEGEYCFLSKKWKESKFEVVLLTQNMRVTNDLKFKEILDRLRWGNCSDDDYSSLKKLKNTKFLNNIVPTRLYSRNADVDKINNLELQKLIDSGNVLSDYPIVLPDQPIKRRETAKYVKNIKLSDSVGLCIGAQVVITRNIDIPGGLINGTRGIITNSTNDGIVLLLLNGSSVIIDYYTFKPDDEPMVEVKYIPLKLAWAISIHSSQGMTLDELEIDLGESIFACGQAYTVLYRVRSMKNVKIVQVNKKSFKTNIKVVEFYNGIYLPTV